MSFASVAQLSPQRPTQPSRNTVRSGSLQNVTGSPSITRTRSGVLAKGTSAPVRERTTSESRSGAAVAIPVETLEAQPDSCEQSYDSFDKMLAESDLPILVDFQAPWCGPCQLMSHVVNSLSQRLSGAVTCVKIDTEQNPALASRYKVQALPTLVLFKDGQPIDKVEGYISLQPLVDRVNFYLGRRMGPGRRFTPTGTVDLGYQKLVE